LFKQGKVAEAIACFKRAIQIHPRFAQAHYNLGEALGQKGKVDEAITSYRKAIQFDPQNVKAHTNLGETLRQKGKVDEAIACFRQAVEINPRDAGAHTNLGLALSDQGKEEEAIACYRTALEINPRLAYVHYNIGGCFLRLGKKAEAIASCRKAIELEPKHCLPHQLLGLALFQQGRFVEARDSTRRCLELLPESHPLRATVSPELQRCERMVQLERKLPSVLSGDVEPKGAERLEFARLCALKKLTASAARLASEAFDAQPRLTADMESQARYNAACWAALAAAGQGTDARRLPDKVALRLLLQALAWLRADLTAYRQLVERGNAQQRAEVGQRLRHWQRDPDLAGLRDSDPLTRLSAEEREACAELWAEVAEC
jgi:tetratricopeptide (TPR) repeat protein